MHVFKNSIIMGTVDLMGTVEFFLKLNMALTNAFLGNMRYGR